MDEFLLLGCDGLWDVLTSQQAVTYARRTLLEHGGDLGITATSLTNKALELGSVDNVSVCVVSLSAAGLRPTKEKEGEIKPL